MRTFTRCGSGTVHYVLARYAKSLFRLLSVEVSSGIIKCRQSEWVKTDSQNYLVTDGGDHIFKGTELQFGSMQSTFLRERRVLNHLPR